MCTPYPFVYTLWYTVRVIYNLSSGTYFLPSFSHNESYPLTHTSHKHNVPSLKILGGHAPHFWHLYIRLWRIEADHSYVFIIWVCFVWVGDRVGGLYKILIKIKERKEKSGKVAKSTVGSKQMNQNWWIFERVTCPLTSIFFVPVHLLIFQASAATGWIVDYF